MFLEGCMLILSVIILWYIKDKLTDSSNPPPGPFQLPYIGNLLQAGELKTKTPSKAYENFSKKYGSVMMLKIGVLKQLIVHDLATMKEILCSDVWVDRYTDNYVLERSFQKVLGIIFNNGDDWKEMRRFAIMTLRDFGFGKQKSMESFLTEEIRELTQRLDGNIQKQGNNIIEMKHFFNIPVLNILWTMIAGYKFSHDDKRLSDLLSLINEMSRANPIGSNLVIAFPWLRLFYQFTAASRARKEYTLQMQKFFHEILVERRAEGNYKKDPKDFIDVFLNEIDKNKNNSSNNCYTDDQFLIVCYDLFAAGAETTSNTLEFALLYMIMNPQVQTKVQAEIDQVVGKNRFPSTLDRPNMPYTEATLLEVQRVSSVLPMIIRMSTENSKVASFDVPKGTVAGLNVMSMHHNEEIWGDPHLFRPERFLDADMNIINANKILPFGLGKRLCLGEVLAKATMFVLFTALLQKYTFGKSPSHSSPDCEPMMGFTLSPKPFHVSVTQRK